VSAAKWSGRILMAMLLLALIWPALLLGQAGAHHQLYFWQELDLLAQGPANPQRKVLLAEMERHLDRARQLAPWSPAYATARGSHAARLALAQPLRQKKLITQAGDDLAAALLGSPAWNQAWLAWARFCAGQGWNKGLGRDCEPLFSRAIALNPTHAHPRDVFADYIYFSLRGDAPADPARVKQMCGQYGQALASLRFTKRYQTATDYLQPKAYERCLSLSRDWRVLSELGPSQPKDWRRLARGLLADQAVWRQQGHALLNGLLASPASLDTVQAVARELARGGRPKQGWELLESYQKQHPQGHGAWLALVRFVVRHNKALGRQTALETIESALAATPAQPGPWGYYGGLLCGWGRHEQGMRVLEKVLSLAPNSPWAHRRLAGCLLQQKRWRQAMGLLKKAVELDPSDPKNWVELSRAQQMGRDYVGAVISLEKALELEPKNQSALARLKSMGIR
jgi:tetratricopeptide (TPR) repeat protein